MEQTTHQLKKYKIISAIFVNTLSFVVWSSIYFYLTHVYLCGVQWPEISDQGTVQVGWKPKICYWSLQKRTWQNVEREVFIRRKKNTNKVDIIRRRIGKHVLNLGNHKNGIRKADKKRTITIVIHRTHRDWESGAGRVFASPPASIFFRSKVCHSRAIPSSYHFPLFICNGRPCLRYTHGSHWIPPVCKTRFITWWKDNKGSPNSGMPITTRFGKRLYIGKRRTLPACI